jgi:hypothetical protein
VKTCNDGSRCPLAVAPPPPMDLLRKHMVESHGTDLEHFPPESVPKYIRQQVEARRRHLASVQQRNNVVKNPQKAARKAVKKAEAQLRLHGVVETVNGDALVKSVANAVLARLGQLEGRLASNRLAKSSWDAGPKSNDQDSWGIAFQLNRGQHLLGAMLKGTATRGDYASVADFLGDSTDHPARTEAEHSAAGMARAIAGVQGASIDQHLGAFVSRPREALAAILDDSGKPETLQTFEVQTHRLEKQLADARTPSERESLGYQVTRRRLLAMHMRGEG